MITVLGINKDSKGNITGYKCSYDGKVQRVLTPQQLSKKIADGEVSNATISINVNIPVQPQSNLLQGYLTGYTTELRELYSKFVIGLRQVWELRDRISVVIDCVNTIYREHHRLKCNYKKSDYELSYAFKDCCNDGVHGAVRQIDGAINIDNKPFYFSSEFADDYIMCGHYLAVKACKNGVILLGEKTCINHAQVPSFEWFKSFYEKEYPSGVCSPKAIKRLCAFPEHLAHFEQMLQIYIDIINKKQNIDY